MHLSTPPTVSFPIFRVGIKGSQTNHGSSGVGRDWEGAASSGLMGAHGYVRARWGGELGSHRLPSPRPTAFHQGQAQRGQEFAPCHPAC